MLQIKNKLQKLYNYNPLRVVRWSPYDNIYYCCTQKTASQWFKSVFRDPLVYKYTGLKVRPYPKLGLNEATFEKPFDKRTFCTHLYIGYPTYLTIPKPAQYKTFFVLRDPRDVLVSWYFSMRYSHKLIGPVQEFRQELEQLSQKDGLKRCINNLNEIGLFRVQRSWLDVEETNTEIRVFRYEDFSKDNYAFLKDLFNYLDIKIPDNDFDALYEKHKFSKRTGGRKQGDENKDSNLRKGISGDWQNYFDADLIANFRQNTDDLVEALGYNW